MTLNLWCNDAQPVAASRESAAKLLPVQSAALSRGAVTWELQHIHRMDSEPDVQLLKTRFQSLLEVNKETAVPRRIFSINKEAIELVSILDTPLVPDALDDL